MPKTWAVADIVDLPQGQVGSPFSIFVFS